MSLIKPAIAGLNTDHALYSDIQAFLEFGQLDKELVNDTALTTTADLVDDAEIGDARSFDATADAVSETVTITGDCTVLVVARLTGSRGAGSSGNVHFALGGVGGDFAYLMYEDFSPYKFQSGNRANYTPGSTLRTNGDGMDATSHGEGHAVAATLDLNGTNKMCLDGALAVETSSMTGTAYAASPVLSFMSSIGASASVNVGAIVVFDRALSDAELQSVTSNPWTLVAEANQPPYADDGSFSIFTNAQVGDVLGTLPVSDSDGSVTSASITGTNFDIDTSGEITVISTSGLSVGTITEDATFTDNDGDSTVVTITINVTAPQLAISSVSSYSVAANANFTVSYNNADAAISAFITLNNTDYALTKVSDTNGVATFTAPFLPDFGDFTANFDTDLTVNITDGTTTTQFPQAFRVQKIASATDTIGVITTPSPVGDYKDVVGDPTGATSYRQSLTGDSSGDIATGVYTVTQAASARYRLYDGVWGDWFTVNYPAPVEAANQAPTANAQTFSIQDDAANNSQIGQFVASDSDGTIDGDGYSSSNPSVSITTGGILLLADNSGLTAGTPLTGTISFRDNDGATGSANFTVNVTATNSAPTANPQTFSISENAANGTQIGQFVASDSDGSIAAGGYSINNNALAISSTGALLLADNTDVEAGTPITATVTFTDNEGATGSAAVTVNVTAVQLTAPTENPDNPMPENIYIRAGTTYPLAQHVLNPDQAALTYSVLQGSPALPAGITLNQDTGVLTSSTDSYAPVSAASIEVDLA